MGAEAIENQIIRTAQNPEHNKTTLMEVLNNEQHADPKQFREDLHQALGDLSNQRETNEDVKKMLEGVEWTDGTNVDGSPTTAITFRHKDTDGRVDSGSYKISNESLPNDWHNNTTGAIPTGD